VDYVQPIALKTIIWECDYPPRHTEFGKLRQVKPYMNTEMHLPRVAPLLLVARRDKTDKEEAKKE